LSPSFQIRPTTAQVPPTPAPAPPGKLQPGSDLQNVVQADVASWLLRSGEASWPRGTPLGQGPRGAGPAVRQGESKEAIAHLLIEAAEREGCVWGLSEQLSSEQVRDVVAVSKQVRTGTLVLTGMTLA